MGARDFAAVGDVPRWNDLSPRLGVSYDLSGNGKTALKGSVSEYRQSAATALTNVTNPVFASVNSTTRTWNDLNGDIIPQENELGPLANASFGRTVVTTTYDPDYLRGWGKRGKDWEVQAGVQHEVRPGLSMNAQYTWHWYGNFLVTDNLAASPSDYSPFCVTAPVDSRLPGGGGNQICGFYDVNPNRFGQVNNLVTLAGNYGSASQAYKGVDLGVNVRLPRGITLQGGTSTGHEVIDICDIAAKVDNPAGALTGFTGGNPSNLRSPSTLYCHVSPPLKTQFKLLGVYPLPWWGLTTSATFQSLPGPEIRATYAVTNAQVAPSLGRNLSGGATVTSVELIAPGTLYGDRLQQLDARVSKRFSTGRVRLQANIDLYNLLNANPVLTLNNQYGAAWQQPTYVLPGRFLKLGAQLDF